MRDGCRYRVRSLRCATFSGLSMVKVLGGCLRHQTVANWPLEASSAPCACLEPVLSKPRRPETGGTTSSSAVVSLITCLPLHEQVSLYAVNIKHKSSKAILSSFRSPRYFFESSTKPSPFTKTIFSPEISELPNYLHNLVAFLITVKSPSETITSFSWGSEASSYSRSPSST